jgi:hypothetical protein
MVSMHDVADSATKKSAALGQGRDLFLSLLWRDGGVVVVVEVTLGCWCCVEEFIFEMGRYVRGG